MPPVLIATPGAPDANSFGTLAEANTYFDNRLAMDPPWATSGADSDRLLIMATRLISRLSQPHKRLVREKGQEPYYVVSRYLVGQPTTLTQALPFPRIGLRDSLGRDVPVDAIPQELKEATFELAGLLKKGDRTLENDVSAQGISSVKAGSVSVSFSPEGPKQEVIPASVLDLMPPWWFIEETTEPVNRFMFDVI